ncbi:hypothetical protein HAHE_03220 [Haloferula helveola]|uniref:Uncharacterized protein n=1 Tax=Haloferula helveola TaxID=490095 RepID=A0ABN6GYQ8_9BACT|nr:hypothetical protein HAHE_03220 [Haloferula helveola]
MHPLKLSLDRLHRILRVFQKEGDEVTVRRFRRNFEVYDWELEQAAELGWLAIETRKPKTGRPSIVARKLSNSPTAKLPPRRSVIGRGISIRHQRFVEHYLCGGGFLSKPNARRAYRLTYPEARSLSGIDASANRLFRHPDVLAYLAWVRACSGSEIPWQARQKHPLTRQEIIETLRAHGCWMRVRQCYTSCR